MPRKNLPAGRGVRFVSIRKAFPIYFTVLLPVRSLLCILRVLG
jgi:hypothetical protein